MKNVRAPMSLSPVYLGLINETPIYYSNLMPFVDQASKGRLDPNAKYFVAIGWHVGLTPNGPYTRTVYKAYNSGIDFTVLLNSPGEFEAFRKRFPFLPGCYLSELYLFYLRHNYGSTYQLPPPKNDKRYQGVMVAQRTGFKNRDLAMLIPDLAAIIPGGFDRAETDVPQAKFINNSRLSRDELNTIFSQSEIALILSYCEGANRSTIEYLISGLPVVSTVCKGGREVFLDETNSILVERKDDRERMKADVLEAFSILLEKKRRGEITPSKIRQSALQRLHWFHLRFLKAIAQSLKCSVPEIKQETETLLVEHASSMREIIVQTPLEPTYLVRNQAPTFYPKQQPDQNKLYIGNTPCLIPRVQLLNSEDPHFNQELVCRSPLNLPDSRFGFVCLSQTMERFAFDVGAFLLKEIFRILQPGGTVQIIAFDLDSIRRFLNLRDNFKALKQSEQEYVIRTNRSAVVLGEESQSCIMVNGLFKHHQFIYDYKTLEAMLAYVGFENIDRKAFRITASREFQSIVGDIQLGTQTQPFNTMIIEAQKSI